MIRLASTTAVLLCSSIAAFAGPVEVPPPPPPVYVEPETCAQAFDCFYGGFELGFGDGYVDEIAQPVAGANFPSRTLTFDGEAYGVFAGYNVQNGSTVFGGEVRYLHVDLTDASGAFEIDTILDIRGRVGLASSDALMIYGAAGWSTVSTMAGVNAFDMTGFNYGVGVEYNINESLFLGADVTGRQVEGSAGVFDYDAVLNTATLRAGFRF
ncbi:outer membrane protein [Gymnodinialimonas hymeniacidonis]|uniref:outer membrane protein n=1 Tax=Gymnodinialimonas hymeniacidonis TaxID=3126508 RepID=UPI0034C6804B